MTARSDNDIDRELQALLDVDPAAEFAVRVRKAIESDAAKSAFMHGSFFRIAVAAAALLVVGTAVYLRQPVAAPNTAASQVSAAARGAPTTPSALSLSLPETVQQDSKSALPEVVVAVEPVRARRVLSDEVVVPAEQLAMYERFIHQAASDPLVASFEEERDLSAALSIPPIVIEPVDAFPEMEGVLQ